MPNELTKLITKGVIVETNPIQKQRTKESVEVRGVCAAIQAMAYPSFEDLNKQLNIFGYHLVKNAK